MVWCLVSSLQSELKAINSHIRQIDRKTLEVKLPILDTCFSNFESEIE